MGITRNPKYKPVYTTTKRYILITGGRGSGKSFEISTFLCLLLYELFHRILFTRWTLTSAELSIIPEFVDKIERLEVPHHFKVGKYEIMNTQTGSDIIFRGIKTSSGVQTANLKSLTGVSDLVVDEAEELVDKKTFDKIDLSIRTQDVQNRVILVLNPTTRDHWIWQEWFENSHELIMIDGCPVPISTHPDVCHIHTTYLDNIPNLSASFLEKIAWIKANDHERYRHEIIGGWLMQPEGVWLKADEIKRFRASELPIDRRKEAEAIMGYIDVADKGTDSYAFPIAHVYPQKVFITDVLFTTEGIEITLPASHALIEAQTIRSKVKDKAGKERLIIDKDLDYVRVEANNQGGEIVRGLRNLIEPSKVLSINSSTNKHTRIIHQRLFILQYCYFLDDKDIVPGSDYHRFMQGLLTYLKDEKENVHDDAPDALAGLTLMIRGFQPHLFNPLPE